MAFQTPLVPIVKVSRGRVAQLEVGVGENQPSRASDVNQVIDYLNNRAGLNATAGTAGNTATINAFAGTLTTATLSTASGAVQAIVITNSNATSTSHCDVYMTAYSGTFSTNGVPVIHKVACTAGTITITIGNAGSNALSGTIGLRFKLS